MNEKYEANQKGLLPFRAPTADEQAITTTLPPAGRVEQMMRPNVNPPPAVEYVDDGLNDINQINKDWETFKASHTYFTCEKKSNTEFNVWSSLSMRLIIGRLFKTTATVGDYHYTRTITIKSHCLYYLNFLPKTSYLRFTCRYPQRACST